MQITTIAQLLKKVRTPLLPTKPTHREITVVENDFSYQRISRGYENETEMNAALRAMTLDNTPSLRMLPHNVGPGGDCLSDCLR